MSELNRPKSTHDTPKVQQGQVYGHCNEGDCMPKEQWYLTKQRQRQSYFRIYELGGVKCLDELKGKQSLCK